MSALARTPEWDCYTGAANDADYYGWSRNRTKYGYDRNGNRISSGPLAGVPLITLAWDEEQRLQVHNALAIAQIANYQYDDKGERRVRRVAQGVSVGVSLTDTLYVNSWITIQKPRLPVELPIPVPLQEGRSQYVWAGPTRLSAKVQTPRHICGNLITFTPETLLYYHGDHLGGTQYLTDYCGAVAEHVEYLPYGNSWMDDLTADIGAIPGDTTADDYRFTGKPLDPESGLYYYGARYFDPKAQMWISPDPVLDRYMGGEPNGGVFTAANLGIYSYASSNPLRYVDPSGRFSIHADRNGANVSYTISFTKRPEWQRRADQILDRIFGWSRYKAWDVTKKIAEMAPDQTSGIADVSDDRYWEAKLLDPALQKRVAERRGVSPEKIEDRRYSEEEMQSLVGDLRDAAISERVGEYKAENPSATRAERTVQRRKVVTDINALYPWEELVPLARKRGTDPNQIPVPGANVIRNREPEVEYESSK